MELTESEIIITNEIIMNKVYFPEDFMLDLPAENFKYLRSQFCTSSLDGSRKQANEYLPGDQLPGKTAHAKKYTST
jgi:hypothetical protein